MASNTHVDLEDIVLNWARTIFGVTSKNSKSLSKLNSEELMYTVDWKRVNFRHSPPEFIDPHMPETPGTQVLFQTEFTNRTDQEQSYAFKAERVTHSTCEVVIEKGVTLGVDLSVKLMTPCEVFEANAGFHKEITCTNAYGETIEEELMWGVDNSIKVPARHKAHASLVISENKYDARFNIHSKSTGKVRVVVTNPKDNNCWVQDITGNLADIVRNNNPKGVKVEKNMVIFDTVGTCNFRFGIKQHVDVSQESLEEE